MTRSGGTQQQRGARDRFLLLSAREQQVARGAHAALTNDENGAAMHLSAVTVTTHLAHISTKLDMPGRVHIALLVERADTATSGTVVT